MAVPSSSEETAVSSDAQEPPDSPPARLPSANLEDTMRKLTLSARSSASLSLRSDTHSDMASLTMKSLRTSPGPPALDDAAIAGAVIGSIFAAGLLMFCIYPFVVRSIRRRRDRHSATFDAEIAAAPNTAAPIAAALVPHSKQQHALPNHFYPQAHSVMHEAPRNRDIDSPQIDEQRGHVNIGALPGRPEQAYTPYTNHYELDSVTPILFPTFDGEYYPASTMDDQPGVLKGTSADYYSPNIPSEAFGMITQPVPERDEVQNRPDRSLSRSSSLRHNVKQMLRHKGTRDRTMSSHRSTSIGEDQPGTNSLATRGLQTQGVIADDTTASPTEVSPTTHEFPPSFPSPGQGSPPNHFRHTPGPSAQPAPGTVNPMDIMPATTFSEMWHRTEYQLFHHSQNPPQKSPPSQHVPMDVPEIEVAPSDPSPTTVVEVPSFEVDSQAPQLTAPGHTESSPRPEPGRRGSVDGTGVPSQGHLTPGYSGPAGRHPSFASDLSTPLRGLASTVPSSQNTPSTQTDTPSPESSGSSDFRHSASPPTGHGLSSPKGGHYRCEEPGCGQFFDQPHKLKHHQRYHAKDHKCHYPDCGKGFGTKTHLQRHINDRHEKKKKYHCAIPDCVYSRTGGKAFPRKDNWKRHMTKIHNMDQQNLPEPVEVDHDMSGT